MKHILLIALVVFVTVGLNAQKTSGFLEWQSLLPFSAEEKGLITIKGQLQSKWEDKEIGFNTFFLVNQDWAEAMLGITWQPKNTWDEFNFTLGVGIETDSVPFRAQTSLNFRKGIFTNLAVFEIGGSGYWYLVVPQVYLSEYLKVGLRLERYIGIGPQVELSNGNLGMWMNPAYNFENGNFNLNAGLFALF